MRIGVTHIYVCLLKTNYFILNYIYEFIRIINILLTYGIELKVLKHFFFQIISDLYFKILNYHGKKY